LLSASGVVQRAIAGEPLPDASVLAAKQPKQAPQPKPKISDVTLTGVIESAEPSSSCLKIKAGKASAPKNQEEWLVFARSDSTTTCTIHATATPDYLRKGQTVEFSGQIVADRNDAAKVADPKDANTATGAKDADKVNDAKDADARDGDTVADKKAADKKVAGKVKEEKVAGKVKELTIFSRTVGAVSKGPVKDHAANAVASGGAKAGANSDTPLTLPDDSTVKTGDSATPAAKTAPADPKTRIVGMIESCDEKSITVTIGQRTIHADLAEIPTINVVLSNPIFAADGKDSSNYKVEGKGASGKVVTMMTNDLAKAKIVVRGTARELDSDRRCAARSIDVTLATPLTGKKPASSPEKKVAGGK
jgi:hypothetical protein